MAWPLCGVDKILTTENTPYPTHIQTADRCNMPSVFHSINNLFRFAMHSMFFYSGNTGMVNINRI